MTQLIAGRYEIGKRIGQGGFATVYKGQDTVTREAVAIKHLKREVVKGDPEIVMRFEREGEALRRLNHPNIVRVLATDRQGDDNYVVMDYVDGGDLRILLGDYRQRGERLPVQRVLEIALDLSDALTRAHRLKIIHRDIKPANVLLAADGTPRLTDFGVARMDDATQMTESGAVIGTLGYLSPEACGGDKIDGRADIWSLGVMLYEMLTLHRPFEENNAAALLTAILSKEPTPLDSLRDDLPPGLADLIHRMLIKDRDIRIGSIRLVGAQIEAILTGREIPEGADLTPTSSLSIEPSMPTPTGTATVPGAETPIVPVTPTSIQPSSRTRWLLGAGIGGVLGLVAIGILFFLLSAREPEIVMVEPVEPGNYMVLIAEPEPINTDVRPITRFIVDDLTRRFEIDIPYTMLRIRQYPDVITSAEQAQAVAEANEAAVIVWGNYDDTVIDLNVQLGSTAQFTNIPSTVTRDDITVMTDARVELTDPREESIAASVTAIMNTLHSWEEDIFNVGANLGVLMITRPNSAPVGGESAAAYWHRYLVNFHSDPAQALQHVDRAIEIAGQQPVLYLGRTLGRINNNEIGTIDEDFDTAASLGPADWLLPEAAELQYLIMVALEIDDARALADAMRDDVAVDNWWYNTTLGMVYLQADEIEQARTVLERATTANPPVSFPYAFLTVVAMREANLSEVQRLLAFIRETYPSATVGSEIFTAVYGIDEVSLSGAMEAFIFFTLEQWSETIEATERSINLGLPLPDVHLLAGLAHCNRGEYAEAEASYTALLASDPDYTIGYVLRYEVRLAQGDQVGALQDLTQALGTSQAANLEPYIPAYQEGLINCENFLELDLAQATGT